MSNIDANLIQGYILNELYKEGTVDREDGDYIFHGNTHDYLVEVRVFDLGTRTEARRLKEEASG